MCQQRSNQPSSGIVQLENVRSGYPFERIGIDIVGPLPVTERNSRYILVARDNFTLWAEAYPLVDVCAETVADVFVREWVCRSGAPVHSNSDQGPQFTSLLV